MGMKTSNPDWPPGWRKTQVFIGSETYFTATVIPLWLATLPTVTTSG